MGNICKVDAKSRKFNGISATGICKIKFSPPFCNYYEEDSSFLSICLPTLLLDQVQL